MNGDTVGSTVAGGYGIGTTPMQLSYPIAISLDTLGNMYIIVELGRVIQWDKNATSGIEIIGFAGTGINADQLSEPKDLFVDKNSYIYIADSANHRIQKWRAGGTSGVTAAGGNWVGNRADLFNKPSSIVFDKAENMYVADAANFRIQKWAKGAMSGVTVIGNGSSGTGNSQFGTVSKMLLNPTEDSLYIVDMTHNRIMKWKIGDTAGTVIIGNGSGSTPTHLNMPAGIFLDPLGNLYVADQGNHRIQKFAPNSKVGVTVAGGYGLGNGAKQLAFPTDVYVDAQKNIYILERSSHRIKKWIEGSDSGTVVFGSSTVNTSTFQQLFNYPPKFYMEDSVFYIADEVHHRVIGWKMDDTTAQVMGGYPGPEAIEGADSNLLANPVDVYVRNKRIYIVDNSNHRIQRWIWMPTGFINVNACDSFIWMDGKTYYKDTNLPSFVLPKASATGEDSALILNLTLHPSPFVSIVLNNDKLEATKGLKTYQWYLNDTAINAATKDAYTPTVSGKYTCEVTNEFGCDALSNEIDYQLPSAIRIIENNKINIYPNPVQNQLTVQLPKGKIESLLLTDISGRIILFKSGLNKNKINLSVANLPAGIYLIQIKSGNKIGTKQFVLQH